MDPALHCTPPTLQTPSNPTHPSSIQPHMLALLCPWPFRVPLQAFRPCPVDICFHQGLFFLTTHTTQEEEPTYGCLSTWDRQGQLLAAIMLGEGCRHPNSLAVLPAPQAA